ncbi:TRAM domain-containing protein [Halococcus salifodinae]|uniref:Deoxyribonuclease/rho motif-related TRAM n=1 Tax=Halococcus salifodinae DSM 8989 TaxID=1227456 RepID=M0MUH8_9EURY|nr:TRAM domain-containing protein [Halococcus salifodinae]EMA48424.1 deoxyribonuclease/rho motif-related TRAM [Halococcus salifodinae DSM 8989]
MVEISDRLRCLFSTTVEQRGDSHEVTIPREELTHGEVDVGETYRVVVLPQAGLHSQATADDDQQSERDPTEDSERAPPVEEGDLREVTIETIGDQGDGIAKLDQGYVVIVPDTQPDDVVTVEITQARENVAFAQVRDGADSNESTDFDDSLANETLGEGE